MASKKREQEYDANRRHIKEVMKGFKFSFLTTLIASGGVFLAMGIYYFVRALAGMAGASLLVGELFVKVYLDGETPAADALVYEYPYGFMAFLLLISALSAASYFTKKRGINTALLILYALGGLYGFIGLFSEICGVAMGLYLFASGCMGVWVELYTMRLHKELDYLSLQEGYPDFIVALDEPHTIANTTGLTYKQSEFQKRQRKENGVKAIPQTVEMDELTIDTPLPKGNRKIDNLM